MATLTVAEKEAVEWGLVAIAHNLRKYIAIAGLLSVLMEHIWSVTRLHSNKWLVFISSKCA